MHFELISIHPVRLLHRILLRFCGKLMSPRVTCNIGDKHLQMAQGFKSCKTSEGTRRAACFRLLSRTRIVFITHCLSQESAFLFSILLNCLIIIIIIIIIIIMGQRSVLNRCGNS